MRRVSLELILMCLLGLCIAVAAIKIYTTNQRIIDKIEKASTPSNSEE